MNEKSRLDMIIEWFKCLSPKSKYLLIVLALSLITGQNMKNPSGTTKVEDTYAPCYMKETDDTFKIGDKPECHNFHELASYYAGKPVTHEVGGQYSSFHAMAQHYNNLGGAR